MLTILDDEYLHEMEICLGEVKSRNAHTVVITDCLNKLSKDKINEYIEIPHVNLFRRYHEGNYSKQTKIWQKP